MAEDLGTSSPEWATASCWPVFLADTTEITPETSVPGRRLERAAREQPGAGKPPGELLVLEGFGLVLVLVGGRGEEHAEVVTFVLAEPGSSEEGKGRVLA